MDFLALRLQTCVERRTWSTLESIAACAHTHDVLFEKPWWSIAFHLHQVAAQRIPGVRRVEREPECIPCGGQTRMGRSESKDASALLNLS